jgi:hypothetical protein
MHEMNDDVIMRILEQESLKLEVVVEKIWWKEF